MSGGMSGDENGSIRAGLQARPRRLMTSSRPSSSTAREPTALEGGRRRQGENCRAERSGQAHPSARRAACPRLRPDRIGQRNPAHRAAQPCHGRVAHPCHLADFHQQFKGALVIWLVILLSLLSAFIFLQTNGNRRQSAQLQRRGLSASWSTRRWSSWKPFSAQGTDATSCGLPRTRPPHIPWPRPSDALFQVDPDHRPAPDLHLPCRVEGRIFRPMAFTIAGAIVGATLVILTPGARWRRPGS